MLTHVTEWGLAWVAGRLMPKGASARRRNVKARMKRLGLRMDTVACDGSDCTTGTRYITRSLVSASGWTNNDVILASRTATTVPTCPRCAVLRDAALEGKLPEMKR